MIDINKINPTREKRERRISDQSSSHQLDRTELVRELTYTNLTRLRTMAWLLILFMLVFISTHLLYINQISQDRILDTAPVILASRLIVVITAIIFLTFSGKLAAPEKIKNHHHWIVKCFTLVNLIYFAFITGLIQSVGPGIASSYIMVVLASAALIYFDLRDSIFIYGLAWVVMTITVWYFQTDWLVSFSSFLNCSVITVLAVYISGVIYNARVREYVNQSLVVRQREKLTASNEMLLRLSYLDTLTGIPNRRYFDEFLAREWANAAQNSQMVAIIMIDIDRFKMFNDTFGHQAGDYCLQRVAAKLNDTIRKTGDIAARYGGEEFVVVLTNTELREARLIADRLRRAVSELVINHPGSPVGQITISLGVACGQPGEMTPLESLIAAADEALYQAKKAGGNNCVGIKKAV